MTTPVAVTLWIIIGLGGLSVGSFLNVVIYRVPRHESLLTPPSHCPHCDHPIEARDNVPLVSWLVLRGRCRHCAGPISVRYPLVELTTALLFLGATWRLGLTSQLPAFLAWLGVLLALALIDVERLVLPRSIVYGGIGLVTPLLALSAGLSHDWRRLGVAGAWAIGWFVVFFLMNFASPKILGFGDVRLSLLLGLGLGWLGTGHVLVGFFLANLVGSVIGLSLIASGRLRRDQPIPYGIFLAAGAALSLFVGPTLVSWIHLAN